MLVPVGHVYFPRINERKRENTSVRLLEMRSSTSVFQNIWCMGTARMK